MILVCTRSPGWQDGYVNDVLTKQCSYGKVEVACNVVGRWELKEDSCACAAESIWQQAALGTTQEVTCSNGGYLRRTCGMDGYWEEVQDFNCCRGESAL